MLRMPRSGVFTLALCSLALGASSSQSARGQVPQGTIANSPAATGSTTAGPVAPTVAPVVSAATLPTGTSAGPGVPERNATTVDPRDRMFAEVAAEVAALEQQGALLKKVVKLVQPSVVHLESVKVDPEGERGSSGKPETVEEAGSGVIIQMSQVHYVLTNRHVVQNASLDHITIRLHDGRFLQPVRLWNDPDTDVAVIQIQAEQLIPARLGNSNNIDIGDFVLAVGSPFGLAHSVSYGIISAKGRRDLELGSDFVRLQDFIQTDAAINPGNSGGPLLNLRGEVIAINTAIASNSGGNEGVSFSIPINLVMHVAQQLVTRGEVDQAYLGVQLDNEFGLEKARQLGLNRLQGALVKSVTPRSPAFFANLSVNDLIVKFNDVAVEDDDHLVNLVCLTPVNQNVAMEVIRGGRSLNIEVKVGNRKHFETRGP